MPKNGQFGEFLKTEFCYQTVLPDRYILIGQTLVKNAKIEISTNATFWMIFKHCEVTKPKEAKDNYLVILLEL